MNLAQQLRAGFRSLVLRSMGVPAFWFQRAVEIGINTGEVLGEPYRNSVWVQRAIKTISGPVSSVELEFTRPEGGAPRRPGQARRNVRGSRRSPLRRDDTAEVLDLPALTALLREPMPGLSYADFVEATIGWLKLRGEAFWLLSDITLLPFPEQAGARQAGNLIVARPDRMRHIVEGGKLVGWVYTPPQGTQVSLLPDQVIHTKCWNPYDEWRGLAEYEAALVASEGDWMAGKFSRNLMSNNGDTGPFIVAKNGVPTDAQREQIIADLKAKRAAQLRGDFRPIFLTGDISIEDPQIKSVDAAFVAQRMENRHEIALAFGVPPSMFDVKAAYSIGSASDLYWLIANTCIPTGEKLCGALAQLARKLTGEEVEAALDWDDHPVMQEVRKERLASMDGLWSKGMPLADISEYLGLELPRFEGDDVGYLPFSVAPVGAEPAAPPETNPALAEPAEENPVAEAARALRARRDDWMKGSVDHCHASNNPPVPPSTNPDCSCALDGDLEIRASDSADARRWKAAVAGRRAVIAAMKSKIDKALMSARAEVLRKLDRYHPPIGSEGGAPRRPDQDGGSQRSPLQRTDALDFLFNLGDFEKLLWAGLRSQAADALQKAGEEVYRELDRDDPWRLPDPQVLHFLKGRENKIKGASQEIFDQIKTVLQDGITNGDPRDTLADSVRAAFNGISDKRAKMIAQTETSAAYGFGRHTAMTSAGIRWKKWLSSANMNVRPAHRAMNGQIVGINEKFLVVNPKTMDIDMVMHPADPNGEPWNVINCHCVEIASAHGPEGEAESSNP